MKTLQNKARQLGINKGQPYQLKFNPNNLQTLVAALSKPPGNRPPPQIGVVLLPSNLKDKYHQVKEASCLASGIPTQVVLGNNVRNEKRYESIMSKLIL